jgi:chromosome segregation ATPase
MPQFQKKASTLIREVEAELADLNRRIDVERDKREQALLADDANALDALDLTISRLQRAQGRQQERLKLLQAQVAQEEHEVVQKRRQALRERFAKKLAEADADAVELQQTLAHLVTLYKRIIDRRETARAAWPIADSSSNAAAGSIEGAALSGSAVKAPGF